jgi:diacylglycerol kinase family enzyme
VLRLLTHSTHEDRALSRHRVRRLELRAARPTQAQLDGETAGAVSSLVVEVSPGALVVRVGSA